MAVTSLPDVPGLRSKGPDFHREFAAVCDRLGIDADAIAALISHESGFNSTAYNATGGASGLMQWMPATAKHLGTTTEAIRQMTAIQQLALVEKTFKPWAHKLPARDVPMVGFGSAFIGKPDDHVAYIAGQKAYDWNKGLDLNQDGKMTLGEVREHVLRVLVPAASKPRIPVPGATPAPAPSSPATTAPASLTSGGLVLVVALALAAVWGARK